MILNKKHGYLIQWLIGVGDLIVLNLLFMAVFHLLGPKYTEAISYNLREVYFVIEFLLFLLFIFYPDSIASGGRVYRQDCATGVRIGYRTYLFIRYLLDLLECRGYSGYLPLGLLRGFYHLVFALAGFCALILKVL